MFVPIRGVRGEEDKKKIIEKELKEALNARARVLPFRGTVGVWCKLGRKTYDDRVCISKTHFRIKEISKNKL